MDSRFLRWITLVGLSVAAAAGCGDDDAAADDAGRDDGGGAEADAEAGGDAEADGDGGVESDAVAGTLSVLVTAYEWYDEVGHSAEGATVALDKPGGERVELTTGADGRAVFDAIDWSRGDASVTAALEGYVVASRTGVTEADGEQEITIGRRGPSPDLVELSGSALNMAVDTHGLIVGATVQGDGYWADGPDWTMLVEPGTPFTIVATERHNGASMAQHMEAPVDGWLMQDHAGLTAAGTVDIDFGTPATATVVDGSFPMPARAESRVRTDGVGWITSGLRDGSATVGFATVTDPSGDWNWIVYTAEYVEPTGVTAADVSTQYCLVQADNYSCAFAEGYPGAGEQDLTLLDLPRMINPPSARSYPLHDPIEWEAWDRGVYPLLIVQDDVGRVWTIRGPLDGTRIVVPELPSTVDATELLGTGVVEASFAIYRLRADDDTEWETMSVVSPLVLAP
jgi:hypothetical protein